MKRQPGRYSLTVRSRIRIVRLFFSISCFTALHGGIILLNIESTVKKSMKIRSMSPDDRNASHAEGPASVRESMTRQNIRNEVHERWGN